MFVESQSGLYCRKKETVSIVASIQCVLNGVAKMFCVLCFCGVMQFVIWLHTVKYEMDY